jgi:sporulation protein YlmC with PRC-barrel domain
MKKNLNRIHYEVIQNRKVNISENNYIVEILNLEKRLFLMITKKINFDYIYKIRDAILIDDVQIDRVALNIKSSVMVG